MKQLNKNTFIIAGLILIIGISSLGFSQSRENQAFLYAQKLYNEGMYSLAASQFKNFAANYPTSSRASEALFMAGEACFKSEKYEEAQQAYLEMTIRYSEAPKVDLAQMKIGDCCRALHDYAKAGTAYQRVKMFYPKSTVAAKAVIESARMFGLAENYSEAVKIYYDYLAAYPDASDAFRARLELIEMLMKKDELKRALNESDKLITSAHNTDNRANARYFKGLIYEEMGQSHEAQAEYHAIIAKSTDKKLLARTYLRLGYIYRLKGEWLRSNEFFTKSLASKGEKEVEIETYLMLGDNYLDLNNFAEAQSYYEKVCRIAKKNESTYFKALFKSGLAFENLADYKNANRYLLRLINEYQPANREAADWLERAYLKVAQNQLLLKNGAQAINYFRKYLDLYKESTLADQIYFKIGEIYEKTLANPEKAIRLYDQFTGKFPNSSYVDDAQLGIARCYESSGQYERAIKEYKTLLSTYPGGADYEKASGRIFPLEKYYIDNPNNALREYSALIGSLISMDDKNQLYFQLAEINFDHIRNYEAALGFYRKSLEAGTANSARDKIIFRMAQSYQFLARLDPDQKGSGKYSALMDSARMNYKLMLKRYPDSQRAAAAAIQLAELKASDAANSNARTETARLYANALKKYPQSDQKDYMLLQLGKALLNGYYTISDSLKAAGQYFQQIITNFPQSAYRSEAQFMLGLYHYRLGDFFAAKDALERYAKNYPDAAFIVKTYDLLAKIEREQENYDKSAEYYQYLITNYYYSAYADSAYLALGDIYLEKKDNKAALKHFLSLEEKFSKLSWLSFDRKRTQAFSADALNFKLGKIYQRLGDFTHAKRRYLNYLKMMSKGKYAPEALLALGRITASEGRHDSDLALSYYKRLKTEFPDQKLGYDASIQTADLLFDEGNFGEAHTEYRKAVSLAESEMKKEYPQARSIVCLYRLGRIAAADKEKENFSKTFGGVANYLAQFEYEKGEYYLKEKSFDRAEKIFDKIRRKYKRTDYAPKAELSLGKLYKILNKNEKALNILTAIPQKYPDSEVAALAYVNLGDYYMAEKQPPNAIAMYKKALAHPQIGSLKPLTMKKLISAYEIFGMSDQQMALIREFIRLYPRDESIFNMRLKIGSIYKKNKEYDQAIIVFEKLSTEAGPDSEAEVQFYLAECYELMGQFERAISEYLKVKYISRQTKLPFGTTAQYRAAELYKKKGQYEEAKQLCHKIIKSRGLADDFGRFAKQLLDEIEQLQAAGSVSGDRY